MRVDRLLSILLIIYNKGMVTGKELADHFEVSLRTIYRDIDKICEAGVPVASIGGKGGGYYLMEGYNIDNIFFNKSEAKALMAVMDNLKLLFGKNTQFNDIVLKFEAIAEKNKMNDDKLHINLSHFSMEDELKENLFIIDKAIEESRLLVFDYFNRNARDEERVVEPIQISFSGGQWHLMAFCRIRNAYRKFKLVRMRNIKLRESFEKKYVSKEELIKIINDGYYENSIRIRLRFSPRIGQQLGEYFFKKDITATEDGSFVVDDYFPHEEGLIKFILNFGQDCEVLEPDYLRLEVKEYLRRMCEKYEASTDC